MRKEFIDKIAKESKEIKARGTVLTIKAAYAPDLWIDIDLAKLTPELLEQLKPEKMVGDPVPKFMRDDVEIIHYEEPVDFNDPASTWTAIEYTLPATFSEEAWKAWDYLDGAAFLFEYKGHLVVTDESLELTEHGDGIEEAWGCPRIIADSWEEIEAWLEGVTEEIDEE